MLNHKTLVTCLTTLCALIFSSSIIGQATQGLDTGVNSDHVLHFQSKGFVQIASVYSAKSQEISKIQNNAVHIPAGATASAPNFYNKGTSNFREGGLTLSATALYVFSRRINCYGKAKSYAVDQFDFGKNFGAADYGYAYDDQRLALQASCAYKVQTAGGDIGAFGGINWIQSASTFKQHLHVPPPSFSAPWTTNDISVSDKGTAFRYKAGVSYYNDYFKMRGTLTALTAANAKVSGTYTETLGAQNTTAISGNRLLDPARLKLEVEKHLKPTWTILADVNMALWSHAQDDNRGFKADATLLDTSAFKNQLGFSLTSINQLRPKLVARTSLAYTQGLTGGDSKGLAISRGDELAAQIALRYELKEKIYIDGGVEVSKIAGGTSTYAPAASVRNLVIDYADQTNTQGWLGLGYQF